MINFAIWQGRLGPVVRPAYGNQGGLGRNLAFGSKSADAFGPSLHVLLPLRVALGLRHVFGLSTMAGYSLS